MTWTQTWNNIGLS